MGMAFFKKDFAFARNMITAFFIEAFFLQLGIQDGPSPTQFSNFRFQKFHQICSDFMSPKGLFNRDPAEAVSLRILF